MGAVLPFTIQPRQVFHRLLAMPGFTLMALMTIAAGIGVNATVFGVVQSVMLKPLSYPAPDELVSVMHTAPAITAGELPTSPSVYFTYREHNQSFANVGLWTGDSVSVTGLAEPEQVDAIDVTESVLPILGVQPALGRLFTAKDVQPGAPDTALLSYGYWQQKAGSDRSIIGRRLMIDGKAREVIGVLGQGFRFMDRTASIFLPLSFERSKLTLGDFSYSGIARLRAGATISQAAAEALHLMPIVNRSYPPPPGYTARQFEDAHIAPNFKSLRAAIIGDVGDVLWVVMGTVGLVLLIACANVANLLLVRSEGRRQELTVRSALGASRIQLAAEIIAESFTLSFAGGGLGLACAYGALKLLVAIAPANMPRLADISIDVTTVLFTAAASLVAGALFGVIPVFKYTNLHLGSGLRQGGRTSSASRERLRSRDVLVVVQVSLAVILLISSALMLRTAYALTKVDAGFTRPESLQTIEISIPETQIKASDAVVHAQQEIARRIAALPGVLRVGMSGSVPMDSKSSFDPVFARDKTYAERDLPVHRYVYVSPGYFETMGARFVAGRDYTWSDLYDRHNVTILSENLARSYWGSARNAIGKQVRDSTDDPWREVIGVVKDIRYNGMGQAAPTIAYWPILMSRFESEADLCRRTIKFVIRSNRAGSESFVSEVRRAVWSLNPSLPVANVNTMAAYVSHSLARTSFALVMLSVAAVMALFLGLVGIYGVIAYSVSQRRREVGVRLAIGAQSSHILGLFVRSGLLMTGVGVLIGVAVSAVAMRLMSSLLFAVQPFDAPAYIAASITLFLAALLASYVPSRQALRVDPAEALRAE